MKNFILTAIMVIMVIAIPTETQAGPFENLLDCADACIDKYPSWSLRLSACAADCYVEFVKECLEMLSKLAEALR